MSKLIVIVGVTGNQGSSVAYRFLQDPTYRVRGLTRNTTSASARKLKDQGMELVQIDLDDPSTLAPAFKGANLIFSVTNFWEPFFRPEYRQKATDQGKSFGRIAYEVELQQGKNIADAAASTVDSLDENGFIASTLSYAKECSAGKWTDVYHFDAKAEVFPGYVREKLPQLAAKMSCVQTGCFMTSFRLAPPAYFEKRDDGTFESKFPMSPSKPIQQLDVNADMGTFTYAVSKMLPGKSYMCAGTTCSWPEFAETWSRITGKTCTYKQVSLEDFVGMFPDRDAGLEIGVMFAYSDEPGYDGGERLLQAEDLREAGIDCPMTSLESFMKRQDWSEVLNV